MPLLLDHDPITGVSQFFDYDESTDIINIRHEQDVSAILDNAKQLRSQAKTFGQIEEWSHYCTIPAIVELELRKKGLKLTDRNDMPAIIREIERNYPYLKTTNKVHSG